MKILKIAVLMSVILGWLSVGSTAQTVQEEITKLDSLISGQKATVTELDNQLAQLYAVIEKLKLQRNSVANTNSTGLVVAANETQYADTLAPVGAVRIPFNVFKLSAPPSKDVVISNLVVERQGLSVDTVLESVCLLDYFGVQIGLSKPLNANHQAVLNTPFVVKAGTTLRLIIAGNRPVYGNSANSGMTVSLALVGLSADAAVSGSLPIVGATHTINEGLVIGAVVANRGAFDPGTSRTINIGIASYNFSSIRITAGSAENIMMKGIKWYQSGSAVPADLANVKVVVDGDAYIPSVSADGKYYLASFDGKGILIQKGFSKEITVKGDLVGGVGRTVDFDIERREDLYLAGETYGFNILAPFAPSWAFPDSATFSFVDDPWYDAAQVTIYSGEIKMSPAPASTVPNQNITVNTPNQLLGGFTMEVIGEPITVGQIGFNVKFGGVGPATDVDDISNITIVDENGLVVAGPVDGMAADSPFTAGAADGSVIFTDAVLFPVGVHNYLVRGRLNTDIGNNVTIQFSTTPFADFTRVRGLSSGVQITPSPASRVDLQTMTVKRGTLKVSVPAGQTNQDVIAGASQVDVGQVKLDAMESGEDIRVITLPLVLSGWKGDFRASNLTNCRLYDGVVSVTSGSGIVNPNSFGPVNFIFDGTGIIIPKGTSKILTLRVDVASSALQGSFSFDVADFGATYTGATGLASAQVIPEEFIPARGPLLTVSTNANVILLPKLELFIDTDGKRTGQPPGTLILTSAGSAGHMYTVERSTDLVNWERPWGNSSSGDGFLTLPLGTNYLSGAKEFYRVIQDP